MNLEETAHRADPEKSAVPINESVLHLASLAKYAVAFFKMLRSSVTRESSALMRLESFLICYIIDMGLPYLVSGNMHDGEAGNAVSQVQH